ncbi:MAG: transketolase [Firmicutes bacterium]|nr:transketolase [Bacillota bacterium]
MLTTIAHTVRGLTADAVEKAKSGHPGMPLGCAEIGAVLYSDVLKHDPTDPAWPDRDRFVLSAGHGSMFIYSFLHLTGYDLPMSELKNFRQLGAKTAGHPEYGLVPGVETTTGPLGQGVANAVGMALAERMLAAKFNRPGYEIVDHYTYVLAGDGCLMEGVSAEASSLAGHLGLGKLIVIYDSNQISIEGDTELAFTESVADRYRAYGWQVLEINGHDFQAIADALAAARAEKNKPSLIVARTRIGRYSALEGSEKSHGAPLGEENVKALKKALGLPDEEFYVPQEVYDFYAERRKVWTERRREWEKLFAEWSARYPELRSEWDAAMSPAATIDIAEKIEPFAVGTSQATRKSSQVVLQQMAKELPHLVGGSADLAPSTLTLIDDSPSVQRGDYAGRNLHFGVREHAMGAIVNGMALHGGFLPYCATFLVFSDYMRPPIRLAALMGLPVIFVFTHDSIYVGEDGPTHQPIEQLESLRLIPNLRVIRPADAEEVRYAWAQAVSRTDGPTALILTRQNLPVIERTGGTVADSVRGGYVVKDADGPDIVLVASGSEVPLCIEAAQKLEAQGKKARVVSVPCRELFLEQDAAYREQVLPPGVPRVIVEAGVTVGWHVLTQPGDVVIGLNRFGESGKGPEVAAYLGLTPERVADEALKLLG